jgi:NAD(P)-dependent dehydrogenase (short-subunit alcohol dehydrogenase family)
MTMPAAYSAIKGALVNFTRYVASYFGPQQIRINAVSPGGVYDNQDNVFVENYCNKVPLRRLATPADVAPTVAFLLSDDSKYITGQNIIIDGGWTII